MQRIKEEFLNLLESVVPLAGHDVLEVGAGDGSRSVDIARRCQSLTGIEPNDEMVAAARARGIPNAEFVVGSGDSLPFDDHRFDLVIFTLSFHHITTENMSRAINEAIRVTRENGYIIFLEPTQLGTFFDSEISFDACDGDEWAEKAAAHKAMLSHPGLDLIDEIDDETVFQFTSVADFTDSMKPKKNLDSIDSFLAYNNFTLHASRRINIFQPKQYDQVLDELQDELVEESLEQDKEQRMIVDNRNSVLTIRDTILKKSQKDDDK